MGGRRWTQEELQILEESIGTFTVATIANRLGRSSNAVNMQLCRMNLSGFAKSTDLLNMAQVSRMLGVERRTIKTKWKSKGLRIMRKGCYLTVTQTALIKYLKDHPEDWNAAKVTDDSLIMGYSWYKEKKKQDANTQFRWTREEVARLKYLRHQGYTVSEIAQKMGRSESSIKYKLYKKES